MLIENNLKKFKEAPDSLRNMVGLFGLIVLIIFTFFILNIYFGPSDKILNVSKTIDTNKLTEAEQKIISSLPRGKLIFYESDQGYKLSLSEYETVCKIFIG